MFDVGYVYVWCMFSVCLVYVWCMFCVGYFCIKALNNKHLIQK